MKKTLLLVLSLGVAGMAHATGYTQTKYPVVLVPGVLGFSQVFGLDYWYQVPQNLQSGGTAVYETSASTLNSTSARGEELLAQVKTIMAISGAQKVNLIGHSHGGVASRYVADAIPANVASVTTIGSPNKGSALADFLNKVFPAGSTQAGIASSIANAFSKVFDVVAGSNYGEDSLAEIKSMTSAQQQVFNQQHPAGVPASACGEGAYTGNGSQHYYSWGGTSTVTNVLDPTDYLFGATGLAFSEPTDGLTGQCSSHFGQVLRDNYPWNHGDEINQVLALRGLFTPDPVSVIRTHVNRLQSAGL